ncbi:hypothetical protein JTE90_004323 [Oedothorax gibbosus]|uniref:Uncharacterized protein n=1 Tax=Oedothorax gibbosus TaxID=931172 RepID=A0AAV6VK46_9ARAC|nr:hypothetical protein JTE90_004323 [Oedothorax gibbosus]
MLYSFVYPKKVKADLAHELYPTRIRPQVYSMGLRINTVKEGLIQVYVGTLEQKMERNIRDVRDIFGRREGGKTEPELRSYDYSPRSRRRHEAMESYDNRVTRQHTPENNRSTTNNVSNKKTSSRHRLEDTTESTRQGGKPPESQKASKENSKSSSKDAAYYANRTLTERDIRHLERHLSMKKTIRKQISRNLHQAFVDDPDFVLNDTTLIPVAPKSTRKEVDRTFTLTRAKVSKSEQNVLDLLKDNEPDSGHCSADNPNSSDDEQMTRTSSSTTKSVDKSPPTSRNSNNSSRPVFNDSNNRNKAEEGKFSFWKMFSVKNKGKR